MQNMVGPGYNVSKQWVIRKEVTSYNKIKSWKLCKLSPIFTLLDGIKESEGLWAVGSQLSDCVMFNATVILW